MSEDKQKMEKVSKYLSKQYEDWRHDMIAKGWSASDASQTAFARYLGVPNPSYSQWVNKSRLPAGRNINIMCSKLGPEILVILEDSDPLFKFIASIWPKFSKRKQEDIVEYVKRLMEEDKENNSEPQSAD